MNFRYVFVLTGILLVLSNNPGNTAVSRKSKSHGGMGKYSKYIFKTSASCQRKWNMTDQTVTDFMDDGIIMADWKFKCYLSCLLRKAKLISDKQVKTDTIAKAIEIVVHKDDKKLEFLRVLSSCSTEGSGKTNCEVAYDFVLCLRKDGSGSEKNDEPTDNPAPTPEEAHSEKNDVKQWRPTSATAKDRSEAR